MVKLSDHATKVNEVVSVVNIESLFNSLYMDANKARKNKK